MKLESILGFSIAGIGFAFGIAGILFLLMQNFAVSCIYLFGAIVLLPLSFGGFDKYLEKLM